MAEIVAALSRPSIKTFLQMHKSDQNVQAKRGVFSSVSHTIEHIAVL